MESRFGHDFSRIRIHTEPPAAPAVNHSSHGLAPPGTSIHIGTVPSPHTVLSPKKAAGGPAPAASMFVGMRLGTNVDSEDVIVTREVGSTQGYDDRLQAIAVARLGGAEPAAVVQGYDGKWHALETTASFHRGSFKAADTPTRATYGLPSSKGIADYRQKVNSLKARLDELNTMKGSGGARKAIEREKDRLREDLSHANQELASFILGVPGSELQFNVYSSDQEPGKINITGQPGTGSPGGSHGPVAGQGGVDFKPGMKSAFHIDLPELEDPARAQSVLFHEVAHLKDYELAQEWIQRYEQETQRPFVSGPPGQKAFEDWMKAQAPARISRGDAELVVDETADRTATAEARANVHTFSLPFRPEPPTGLSKSSPPMLRRCFLGGNTQSPPLVPTSWPRSPRNSRRPTDRCPRRCSGSSMPP